MLACDLVFGGGDGFSFSELLRFGIKGDAAGLTHAYIGVAFPVADEIVGYKLLIKKKTLT